MNIINMECAISSLFDLMKQKEELEEKIKLAKKSERSEVLKTVKRLSKEFNFTAGMLRGSLSEKK